MMKRRLVPAFVLIFTAVSIPLAVGAGLRPGDPPANQPQSRAQEIMEKDVRKQLRMLPYVDVFDWLEAQVDANKGTVVLRGQVVRPSSRKDAERRVKKIEGVEAVANEIEVLPPSPSDSRIRRAVYNELFGRNSPLFRYANNPIPPIRIIVKDGHVTLKGIVNSSGDKQIAYARASIVPGIFSVKNELAVER